MKKINKNKKVPIYIFFFIPNAYETWWNIGIKYLVYKSKSHFLFLGIHHI